MSVPDFVARAIEAQGKVSVEEVVRVLQETSYEPVESAAGTEPQLALAQPVSPSREREIRVDWLDTDDLERARQVGRQRLEAARRLGRTQPFGDPGEQRRVEIDEGSCIAELAVAIYLSLPWRDELVDDLTEKPPDVGDDIEVRWTAHAQGHLITHDADHDRRTFVLVRRAWPDMRLVGWVTGQETKRAQYQNHPAARNPRDYWMPAEHLELMWRLRSH